MRSACSDRNMAACPDKLNRRYRAPVAMTTLRPTRTLPLSSCSAYVFSRFCSSQCKLSNSDRLGDSIVAKPSAPQAPMA
jgi:hypothetical protein